MIPFPDKKYQIIYADPPWEYNFSGTYSRAITDYPTLGLDKIKEFPVKSIADENSVLLMWSVFPKLDWAIPVIESWGFQYITCLFVWVKSNKRTNPKQTSFLPLDSLDAFTGMGYYTRSNVEICLLGKKGNTLERKCHNIHQVIYEPIDRHSKKPDICKTLITKLFGDLPRIELFARQRTLGWDVWGNEV